MASPLTPPNCDLRDFPRMMIDIPRLFGSAFDMTANDAEWRCGVTLWLKGFHQVPAASLPDDDCQLARLCGFGRDVKAWNRCRAVALRGWIKADDGRLYHPVVAEIALEAWLEKLAQRLSSGAGNAKRWEAHFDVRPIQVEIALAALHLRAINPRAKGLTKKAVVTAGKINPEGQDEPIPPGGAPGVPPGQENVPPGSQGKGREGIKEEETGASASPSAPGRGSKPSSFDQDQTFTLAWDSCSLLMRRRSKGRAKAWPFWRDAAVQLGRRYPDERAADLRLLDCLRRYQREDADYPRTGGPGLKTWLTDEKWEHWLPVAAADYIPDDDDWQVAMEGWRHEGRWAPKLGPKPGEPGCRVPNKWIIRAAGDAANSAREATA